MRRSLLIGACVAALGLTTGVAGAQGMMSQGLQQTEWADGFDAPGRDVRPVSTRTPILSAQTVPAMEYAIAAYQDLVDRGGWGFVPEDTALKIGMRHPNVLALRQRLIASGDLRETAGESQAFDSYVQAAVKRFQERHGLPADGVVGISTLNVLNVPAQTRLHQLETNLERIRAMGTPADRYVMVNVPGAQIEVVEAAQVISRHTAVVGKIDRQTPLLSSRIHEINFNPFWHVPPSLIRKDLIPKMQKDPNYLTDQDIRIYDKAGNEVPPSAVDWNTDEATQYTYRQPPGDKNSLGSIRLNFHNPHSVFLHDTPAKTLFGSEYRFESSGCVRVMNVRELVAWVLRDNGYTRAAVDQAIRSGERLDVKVANPPVLYTVYFTAWTTGDGVIHFRDDIYNYDAGGAVALNQPAELIGSPLTP